MSDQNLDYANIRGRVEKNLYRQKWMYRITFFLMHLLFFGVTMLIVWGIVAADPQLRDVLFNNESGAATIVILPTILWAAVILFHLASLYFESGAGEKAIRERLLMREIGKDILRQAQGTEAGMEKPKRRASALETERVQWSDDGEFVSADEDEHNEQNSYDVRTRHAGGS